ncbi:acetyl-CoA hydrolase/transferase family protein [Burkholderia multivorans]|uniref:acetyl-CoA hydrolase/transferase family protein n=1 Tax=Burkholderia multivorans TaxID=87883 RepID=UPI001FC7BEBF|nr:acetyl-CoA hydrolase/transferase C-terminal domain-containing protein [Burkholderia multivorans]MCL4646532.1 acetyl-CoA hydrolase [Burkholderia multivorans]UQN90538.1 acetyl-CoA hydrolase [Burkholderia multivorans]UQO75726.1 acetyl-CoA hydrolase [Burkholderia multivorans]UQP29997.1 acetyl-CoA hydrolase [Burkholderia multivorans]UQP41488.1 acetyl-CoA hydrolase [Burkholderia multivorans]
MWGQSHAEPVTLMRALVAQRHSFKRIRVFLGIGLADVLTPEHADAIDFLAYCGSGANRKLARANVLDILPAHYSQLPELIRSGALRIDVVMLQVSPPDEHGRYSLGLAREYLVEALKHARAIVAEVHPDVPWTYGGPFLRAADIDLLVTSDTPFSDAAETTPGPVEQAIGQHVASLVEDGATLQTGIGAIPDAVMAALHDKRDLGVHTGSIGDGIAALCEAGVVTNARKTIDAGITVGGVIIGSARVRRFAHRNPALELRGTEYTHNPHVLRRIERFTAINSAVEVDLTGQVNAEVVGGTYVGAVGGVGDFLRAAQASRGGVPIVALPSTAGAHSRIVTKLAGPVTVPRSDACVIVTEYGIADLRGLSLAQRVPKMIAIAHPDHRERLAREAGLSG